MGRSFHVDGPKTKFSHASYMCVYMCFHSLIPALYMYIIFIINDT